MKIFVSIVREDEKLLCKTKVITDLEAETIVNFYPYFVYAAVIEAGSTEEALAAVIMDKKVHQVVRKVPVYKVIVKEVAKDEELSEEDLANVVKEEKAKKKKEKSG